MLERTVNLPRAKKRLIFLLIDMALAPLSLYLAFVLRHDTFFPIAGNSKLWALFIAVIIVSGPIIYALKLPRIKLNAFESRAMLQVGLVAVALSLAALLISYLFQLPTPLSTVFIFGALFFLFSTLMRVSGLYLLTFILERTNSIPSVAIYGAGTAGIQLALALRQARAARPVAFIDDNKTMHGLMVSGLPVYSRKRLEKLIKKTGTKRVLVAMPSISKKRLNVIISQLSKLSVEVQVLPTYATMFPDDRLLDRLRPVVANDLLGREKVDLGIPEIAKTYAGRVVMVTGAGGSIGSELCRQLLSCRPARIVLFEQGEYQLYSIDQELSPAATVAGVELKTILGSIGNKALVTRVINDENVDVILHAAAYKHVPMVEDNELEGARNNVLGTQIVAQAAEKAGIERFILISTDKAVRPTNVMGATKRMAELVVQDIQSRSRQTEFGIVRFGNVLGSSGSVFPLFQKQIQTGGPLTVTHPDVTRFFMTITEAARLVLLVGAYVRGSDVFVLDMGSPRKILDVAHQMITFSGRQIYNPVDGSGDIKIEFTGLRPGEKLHEELLIDIDTLQATPHSKILKSEISSLSQIEIAAMLREINDCINQGNPARLRQLITLRVEGYRQHPSVTKEM